MKGLGELFLGCIAGGLLGTTTFLLVDAVLVKQYAHANEYAGASERAMEALDTYLETEVRRKKLTTQQIHECKNVRSTRNKLIAIAEKNKTSNLNNYNQALASIQRADKIIVRDCT